jgi:hypothetical protein
MIGFMIGRGEKTRTSGPMHPMHVRYQLRHTPINNGCKINNSFQILKPAVAKLNACSPTDILLPSRHHMQVPSIA